MASMKVGSSGNSGDWNSKAHGSARWLIQEEANQLQLNERQPGSVILGQDSKGRLAYLNQPGAICVLAPSRSGKGLSHVQANLLSYGGSIISCDPKAENCAVSYKYRAEQLGQDVYILDPTQKLKSYGLDYDFRTCGFNPLVLLRNVSYVQMLDHIGMFSDALLVPQEGANHEAHWRDGGKAVISGLLTYLVFFMPQREQNLITLSRLLSGLILPLEDIFQALVNNGHPDPVMADVIAKSGAWYDKVNVKERASFISMAIRSLAWLNSPVWHDQLTKSEFDPRDLLNGNTTLYIVCPFEKLQQYAGWHRLVVTCCIIAHLQGPRQSAVPSLFLLDEYAACIGRLEALENSIPYIEGLGARYDFIFQQISQMKRLWPDPQYHAIFASASAHIFFNVSDQDTAEYLSRYLGKCSAMTPGPGGMSLVSRDLMTPDEIRTLPYNDLIACIRGYRPAWLSKLDVRTHPAFRGLAQPNPAYFVLPESQKQCTQSEEAVLSTQKALSRAQETVDISLKSVTEALERKYPGRSVQIKGDMCGYDEPFNNPETGKSELVFVPIMHVSLLKMLAKGGITRSGT